MTEYPSSSGYLYIISDSDKAASGKFMIGWTGRYAIELMNDVDVILPEARLLLFIGINDHVKILTLEEEKHIISVFGRTEPMPFARELCDDIHREYDKYRIQGRFTKSKWLHDLDINVIIRLIQNKKNQYLFLMLNSK